MPVATESKPARSPRPAPSSEERTPPTSLAEQVCLTLITQGASHGWAVGSLLAAGGDIGRIWTLSRPLTYRAIDLLADKKLIARRGRQGGQGRDRVLLAPTATGRRTATRWLDTPVNHIRDVRTELLVKLVLRQRTGLDNDSFLTAQREVFEPIVSRHGETMPGADIVALWRHESARAVRRFLDNALRPPRVTSFKEKPDMRLSARNQLRATVTTIHHGEVMSTVKVTLDGGQDLTAAITREAAEALDLASGDPVVVVIKSTEVMIGKE